MMIKKYSHKTIDKENYVLALQNSVNYMIYAELWYLDIVSPDGYDIWVLNDYEALMPVPYQTKAGFKFVIQPPFCQQLGIFYKTSISKNTFTILFSKLKEYKVRSYHFNEDNTFHFVSEISALLRSNQTLHLNKNYSELYKHFNNNRKREINKIQGLKLMVSTNFSMNVIFNVINDNKDIFSHKNKLLLYKLLNTLNQKKKLYSFLLISNNTPIACLILIKSKNRVISLLPLRTNCNIKGTISFLYSEFFKQFSNSDYLFDFEGSDISGIYDFNNSLGAETRKYISFKNFEWFEILKKIRTSNH